MNLNSETCEERKTLKFKKIDNLLAKFIKKFETFEIIEIGLGKLYVRNWARIKEMIFLYSSFFFNLPKGQVERGC